MPKLTTTQAAAILADRGIRTIYGKIPTSTTVAHWCSTGEIQAELVIVPSNAINAVNGVVHMWQIEESAVEVFQQPRMGRPKTPPLETKPDPQAGICAAMDCERRTKYKSKRFCVKHERQYYRERQKE